MAFVILDGAAPQTVLPRQLKTYTVQAYSTALDIQRQLAQMNDTQVEEQFGVPTASVQAYRNAIAAYVTAFEGAGVTGVLSSLGFSS